MLEMTDTPSSVQFVWLLVFALGVAGAALVLRKVRQRGFAWWARLSLLILCVFAGHAIQAVTSLRGMPGFPAIILFPLVPFALGDDYYMHFRNTGMDTKQANDLGISWGYKHGFMIWLIVAAMVFFWVWLRPPNRILHGDDEPQNA